jgi:cobalt-zinc-cadmium efflux system outer membrane protein
LSGPTALDILIGYALANNPEIQAARYSAQSLGARVPQANSLPDPTLMATAFLEEIQTAAGPQEVAMSLSQKFPWFGKRALRARSPTTIPWPPIRVRVRRVEGGRVR